MFSYFQNGITDTNPSKSIDLPQLIKIIKDNPNKPLIDWIRVLRSQGNQEYKELKRGLPNITPNCIVRYRKLEAEHFNMNFIMSSGYIYFDTDDVENLDEYKEYFIKRYGHLVSMVCKSSSCGGLSILFKLTNTINSKQEFFQVWDTIRTTILHDERIDINCKDIGRGMFISFDPEAYINYESEITIDTSICISPKDSNTNKKRVKHPISNNSVNNKVVYSFSNNEKPSIISIDQVLDKLITKTIVPVENLIVDMKPVHYAEVFVPKVIKDGTKHSIYTSIIHQLVYLNPNIEKEYIFSYLWYINNTHAKPPMEKRELIRLFNMVYNGIKETGDIHPKIKTKWVHFNPKRRLTGKEKNKLANTLNGYYRRYQTINKIITSKQELMCLGEKITQNMVSKISGLSLKTVQTYFNSDPIDIDLVLQQVNDPEYQIIEDKPTGRVLNDRFSKFGRIIHLEEYIHPECPKWVLEMAGVTV